MEQSNFKKCKNGHYYDASKFDHCPYCPPEDTVSHQNLGNNTSMPTQIEGDDVTPRNQYYGDRNLDPQKTQIFGEELSSSGQGAPSSRTVIIDPEDDEKEGGGGKSFINPARKLVGWLISYTIDKNGVDFKIFEGRNTLGHLPSNNICVATDKTISGHHLTILFRNGKFKLRDELSANGTFINNQEIDTGEVYPLHDGDTIKIGQTVFTFKTPVTDTINDTESN